MTQMLSRRACLGSRGVAAAWPRLQTVIAATSTDIPTASSSACATSSSRLEPDCRRRTSLARGGSHRSRRRRALHVASSSTSTAETSSSAIEEAAEALADLCTALQSGDDGLDDGQVSELVMALPELLDVDAEALRSTMQDMAKMTGSSLAEVAGLVIRVPAVLSRTPEAVSSKMAALAHALELTPRAAIGLVASVPQLFTLSATPIVKDRIENLARMLGQPIAVAASLTQCCPLLWVIPPLDIQAGIPQLSEKLGLTEAQAQQLLIRVPVVMALDRSLLVMQVQALSATSGVPVAGLLELLGRCLAMVAVPAEVLGPGLLNLSTALSVPQEAVLDLLLAQPTLLAAQLPVLVAALDALEAGLSLDSRTHALALLAKQPALLYDTTPASIAERLAALSAAFQIPVEELAQLAGQAPQLLIVAQSTIRRALQMSGEQNGGSPDPGACLQQLVEDPAVFITSVVSPEVQEQWMNRLGLQESELRSLLVSQPTLLEVAPTTVKARLESLAALFSVELRIAAALVAKHPALAAIPPNVIITRVKGISLALGMSLQTVGVVIAKAPAILACCVAAPGELNRDLKPHMDAVQEVIAAYEYYTLEWIKLGVNDVAPQQRAAKSFSAMDSRY